MEWLRRWPVLIWMSGWNKINFIYSNSLSKNGNICLSKSASKYLPATGLDRFWVLMNDLVLNLTRLKRSLKEVKMIPNEIDLQIGDKEKTHPFAIILNLNKSNFPGCLKARRTYRCRPVPNPGDGGKYSAIVWPVVTLLPRMLMTSQCRFSRKIGSSLEGASGSTISRVWYSLAFATDQ